MTIGEDHDSSIGRLIAVCRSFVETWPRESRPSKRADVDPGLLDLALREGIAGVLPFAFPTLGPETVSTLTFAQNVRYQQLLTSLDAALGERSAEVMVVKGAALLHSVYAGRTSVRPLSDVDVVVRPRDRPALEECLGLLGFRNSPGEPDVWRSDRLAFDVHESWVEGRIRSRGRAFQFDEARFWTRSSPLSGSHAHVRVPSDPEHLLLLAVHALKHSHDRLIWVLDLALMCKRVDLCEVSRQAAEIGCLRVWALTLVLLREMFALEFPPQPVPRLNRVEAWYVRSVLRRRTPYGAGELVMVFSIADVWGRLAYLAELCFPRLEVLARLHPATPRWRLPFARAAHLVGLGWAEVKRWLRDLWAHSR